jgi:N-acetylmuramoyl-L-alanine amidase
MLANQSIAFMFELRRTDEWSTQIPGSWETMHHVYQREQPLETTAKEIIGRGTKPMLASLCAAGLLASAPVPHSRGLHAKTDKAEKVHKAKVKRKKVKIKIRKRHVPLNTYSGPINDNPMAVTTWMEARNQPRSGRLAVMHVIKNRVHANKRMFGIGLRGVCRKPWQYSAWNRNDDSQRVAFFNMLQLPDDHPQKILWRSIQNDAKEVWAGRHEDNTGGATYYHTPAVSPRWRYDMKVVGVIKDHIFYRPMTRAERKVRQAEVNYNRKLLNARRTARKAHQKKPTKTIVHRYHVKPQKRTSQLIPKAKPMRVTSRVIHR